MGLDEIITSASSQAEKSVVDALKSTLFGKSDLPQLELDESLDLIPTLSGLMEGSAVKGMSEKVQNLMQLAGVDLKIESVRDILKPDVVDRIKQALDNVFDVIDDAEELIDGH